MSRSFGLQWHLTNDCDQRCKHCYIWQKHDKEGLTSTPTLEQCQSIIEDFCAFCGEMGVIPYFSITGGDPLLYQHIWEVLEVLRRKSISFTILGNPFHLTDDRAKLLKDLGCVSYQMSLDGLEKTHDSMRKPGSFLATLAALPLLHDVGIRSMIMSTASMLNYRELPDVARLCVEHHVGNFAFSRYCPTRGDTEFNMSPQLYRQFLTEMWQVFSELVDSGTNFALKDHLWVPYLYEEGLYQLGEVKDLVLDGCNCGISHMTLLPNGTVYACRRFESLVGSIKQRSFKEIFLSPEMDTYRQIENLSGCKDCVLLNYCRGCHAVSAGTTGDFFSKDPQCWRV
ncbi:MAG: radical SAM/SPASM domain protein, ACGX system [Patescibacteria group bacterium]